MKSLREAPTRSGRPKEPNSVKRANAIMLCSCVLPKPMPGSSTIFSRGIPAFRAISSERAKKAAISFMMSIAGSARSRLCITMMGALRAASSSAMPLSRWRPQTSLAIVAPLSSAQATTSDFMLSMETGTPSERTSASTGCRRRSSMSAETACAPPYGRVDSAPMSIMSAPSAIMRLACASARSGVINCPPSENESGVTLRTPITAG